MPDLDLCSSCGRQFPPDQVCDQCLSDRTIMLLAVEVLKRRGWKRSFLGDMFIRALEKYAERLKQDLPMFYVVTQAYADLDQVLVSQELEHLVCRPASDAVLLRQVDDRRHARAYRTLARLDLVPQQRSHLQVRRNWAAMDHHRLIVPNPSQRHSSISTPGLPWAATGY